MSASYLISYMASRLRMSIAALALVFSLIPDPAASQDVYEELLTALAASESKAEADALAARIWQHWLTAPDEAAQEVLNAALRRRASRDFLGAIQHLDRLIAAYPDYAEGWNQRATMHFLIGDFEASLADVDEVLMREPRHFGALSGKAVISLPAGQDRFGAGGRSRGA